ncbi:homoserine kinase [Bacillus solimangrovi]|uniref:Homoserine kinase n=1 Tax=Bacillus solimangrovi TaxID=1305675 RepID=A0A1E5LJ11_9BACI|nr:homoserine kinase [Bacillus solimangrovi]OEH94051.1 homoserine kinase [Bacillus solimangrovi]
MKEKIVIKVPGSTANLGPGFDSVGLALNRYTTLEATPHHEWKFVPKSRELEGIPEGKDNLVYKAVEAVAAYVNRELPPTLVEVSSDIPLSRGLGSSAAAIVAGIELGVQLLQLDIEPYEKLRLASLFEGHPDNVAASLYGGLVVGSHREDDTDVIHDIYPQVDIVVYIPTYELKTEKARHVLPDNLAYKDAVEASAVSNVLVAAIMQNRWDLAGKMMKRDRFHQPYRGELVKEMNEIIALTDELGAYGIALSGAGPTMIAFAPVGKGEEIIIGLQKHFANADISQLKIDRTGVRTSHEFVHSEENSPIL